MTLSTIATLVGSGFGVSLVMASATRFTTGSGPRIRPLFSSYLRTLPLLPLHFFTWKQYALCESKHPWIVRLVLLGTPIWSICGRLKQTANDVSDSHKLDRIFPWLLLIVTVTGVAQHILHRARFGMAANFAYMTHLMFVVPMMIWIWGHSFDFRICHMRKNAAGLHHPQHPSPKIPV